jgi:hypothetical protein
MALMREINGQLHACNAYLDYSNSAVMVDRHMPIMQHPLMVLMHYECKA